MRAPTAEEIAGPAVHALEVEQALLGVVLFDNEAFHYVEELQALHFYEPLHQRFWTAIEERIAAGLVADPVSLHARFADGDPAYASLGGLRYVADLAERAPSAAFGTIRTSPGYARAIKDAFVRRELVAVCGEITSDAVVGEKPAEQVLALAESAIFRLGETGGKGRGFNPFSSALEGALVTAEAAMRRDGGLSGITTGLMDLDKQLGGLHPSDLVILAGRPSMGKTALATNIAYNAARAGVPVGFFSLEMSEEQLAHRLLADVAGISSDRIRKGAIDNADYYRLRDTAQEIHSLPLEIDDSGGLALAKLATRARRLKRTKGLELLVIDYLQLITVPDMRGQGRVNEVTAITQALKALAKELNIPVLALSQLSRQVEQRDDKRPQLSDLRESGSIEQDADVVMFVYREAYYLGRAEPKPGTPDHLTWEDDMARAQGRAECIIGKQRHGPIGTVNLSFNEDFTRFGNLAREERYDARQARYDALEDA